MANVPGFWLSRRLSTDEYNLKTKLVEASGRFSVTFPLRGRQNQWVSRDVTRETVVQEAGNTNTLNVTIRSTAVYAFEPEAPLIAN